MNRAFGLQAKSKLLVSSVLVRSEQAPELPELPREVEVYRAVGPCRGLVEDVKFVVLWAPQALAALAPPVLLLDGVTSAQNLEQLLRSGRALGVDSFVLSPSAWPSLNGRACAVAQGAAYGAAVHRGALRRALRALQAQGVRLFAAEHFGATPLAEARPATRRWALVLGNEERGVSEAALALCEAVRVPQRRGRRGDFGRSHAVFLVDQLF